MDIYIYGRLDTGYIYIYMDIYIYMMSCVYNNIKIHICIYIYIRIF